jgi:hypothetical protein
MGETAEPRILLTGLAMQGDREAHYEEVDFRHSRIRSPTPP